MQRIHIDISLVEDLQIKGHSFTAAYLFHYMQDEIKKGNTILLERPVNRGPIIHEFTEVNAVKDYFSTFIKKYPSLKQH